MATYARTRSGLQRGSGVGGILRGIYKIAMPHIKKEGAKIAKAIGKEALRAGSNVIGDIATRGIPIRDSIRQRARESGRNLKRKADEKVDTFLSGSGYKMPREQLIQQYVENPDRVNIAPTKRGKTSAASRKKKTDRKKSSTPRAPRKPKKRTARDIFSE